MMSPSRDPMKSPPTFWFFTKALFSIPTKNKTQSRPGMTVIEIRLFIMMNMMEEKRETPPRKQIIAIEIVAT